MQIAWLFPGQGSQKLGMGKDIIELNDAKRLTSGIAKMLGMNCLTFIFTILS